MNMHTDIEYWTSHVPPAAPSDDDVEVFRSHIIGSNTLLLGSTKQLLGLCDIAYDLCPKYDNPIIQDRDWITIDSQFDTIISDGALCFGRDFSLALLERLSKHCKRFVLRSFVKVPVSAAKSKGYGSFWPKPEDFQIAPTKVINVTDIYNFYIWDFV